jgi:hypothetical protein
MEVGDSSPQGIGFAHREDFHEECYGAFALGVYSFLVLIELLFCLPHKGKGKQTEPDSLGCDVFDDDCVTQFKEVCQVSVGILTGYSIEWTGLHHGD